MPPGAEFVGALYTPPGVIVPSVLFPPTTEFTDQITELFCAPVTQAVNAKVSPVAIVASVGALPEQEKLAGMTRTRMPESTVTVAIPYKLVGVPALAFPLLVVLVATTVMVEGLGTVRGAV